jgi:hypothetical protein
MSQRSPKFNSQHDIKNATLYECDQKRLESLFSKTLMPNDYKYDASEMKPQGKAKKKQYREEYPDEVTQEKMRDVEQNSDEWHQFRSRTAGGSGLAALLGRDAGYTNNVYLWFQESGRTIKQIPKTVLEWLFMKHGHYLEEEAAKIYSCAMGTMVFIVGIVLHFALFVLHISPDSLSQYFKNVFHNKYTLWDSLRGNQETKCPIFQVYATVPPYYMIQVQMQMHVFLTAWCDFDVHWKVNEKAPPIDVSTEKGPGVFKVGHTKITRIYRCNAFCEKVLIYLRQFLQQLSKQDMIFDFMPNDARVVYKTRQLKENEEIWVFYRLDGSEDQSANIQLSKREFEYDEKTGDVRILYDWRENDSAEPQFRFPGGENSMNNLKWQRASKIQINCVFPPKKQEAVALPDVVVVPLKEILWYIRVPEGENPYKKESNTLEGEVFCEIINHWDTPPYLVSVNELTEQSEYANALEKVPTPAELPKGYQIKNPVWKKKMQGNINKLIDDVIWEFSTAKNNVLVY